jgi:FkbM family methyltransferase
MIPLKRLVTGALARARRPFSAQHKLIRALSPHLPEAVCVDVGASYYPHVKWHLFIESPATRWIAVEPNAANAAYVSAWRWPSRAVLFPIGLSRTGGPQTLYVTNVDSGSSLLPPRIADGMKQRVKNLDYFFPMREVTIETRTLTDVLMEVPVEAPVFVKLDTQGTELDILRGAESLIASHRIAGIETEATLLAQPVMHGSGKFWQLTEYLESHGMELLTVKPIYGPSRFGVAKPKGLTYLNECDAVFAVRRDVAAGLSVAHRAGLLAFYLAYRLYEEGISLLDEDTELRAALAARGADTVRVRALLVAAS